MLGYQLSLSRSFSLDFNLGLGYTHSAYDSFGMTDGVRIHKQQDGTKNFWGPHKQASARVDYRKQQVKPSKTNAYEKEHQNNVLS